MEEYEASTDVIISIMREQHTYVPCHGNDYLGRTFCVGDLFTVERSQNPQDDLSNPTGQLEGLIPAFADFHSYGNCLEVNYFLWQMYSVFIHW